MGLFWLILGVGCANGTQGSPAPQKGYLASKTHEYSPCSHPILLSFFVFIGIVVVVVVVGVQVCHRGPHDEG
jgi:hypothetical protein